nr:hypothetical protein [uncultured bacterium]
MSPEVPDSLDPISLSVFWIKGFRSLWLTIFQLVEKSKSPCIRKSNWSVRPSSSGWAVGRMKNLVRRTILLPQLAYERSWRIHLEPSSTM